jgi:CBS domain-containing protein
MRDLVRHVLQVLNDVTITDGSDWALGELLGQVSQTDRPLKSLEKHHQLVKAKMETPLIDIVEEFTRADAHRVAVFDKENFVGVISQSTIANLVVGQFGIRRPKGCAAWVIGEKTVGELGIMQTNIVSVLPSDTVMQALFLMESENVSSCAVIEHKKLYGSISATDIKVILSQRNGWRKVFQTCAEFFKVMRNEQVLDRKGETAIPTFTIHSDTKLVSAMVSV